MYRSREDEIVYRRRSVDRHWTSAHEFGHALHHEELAECGVRTAPNPTGRQTVKLQVRPCGGDRGLSLATSAAPGLGTYPKGWEKYRSPAPAWRANAEVEGNVVALFHDLIDENNEGDDDVSLNAFHVARVFRTCRTSQGKREDIAAFVWCMENRFDADLHRRHFPGLNQTRNPISTRSSNWDSDDIRSTWVYNIGKR